MATKRTRANQTILIPTEMYLSLKPKTPGVAVSECEQPPNRHVIWRGSEETAQKGC